MTADDENRARVLSAASRLLSEEGPDALSNRRVASEAGVSTMAIYTHFGSKGGILDALYVEGAQTLAAAQARIPESGDPLDEIVSLCRAYRKTALEYAGHYRILFSGANGWKPSVESRAELGRTFERLVRAVARGVALGRIEGEPTQIAFILFATCHGLVTLELDGYAELVKDPVAANESAVRRVLAS